MYACATGIFFFTSLIENEFFFPFLWKPPVSLVIYSKRGSDRARNYLKT